MIRLILNDEHLSGVMDQAVAACRHRLFISTADVKDLHMPGAMPGAVSGAMPLRVFAVRSRAPHRRAERHVDARDLGAVTCACHGEASDPGAVACESASNHVSRQAAINVRTGSLAGTQRKGRRPRAGRQGARRCAAGPAPYQSIIDVFQGLCDRGIEVRLLHSGVPSGPMLARLRRGLPRSLTMRRCPRVHAKAVIVDGRLMYLGSANLTGAGLGAKSPRRRNFEAGIWTDETVLIDSVMDMLNGVWTGRRCPDCGRKDHCPVPLEEPNL